MSRTRAASPWTSASAAGGAASLSLAWAAARAFSASRTTPSPTSVRTTSTGSGRTPALVQACIQRRGRCPAASRPACRRDRRPPAGSARRSALTAQGRPGQCGRAEGGEVPVKVQTEVEVGYSAACSAGAPALRLPTWFGMSQTARRNDDGAESGKSAGNSAGSAGNDAGNVDAARPACRCSRSMGPSTWRPRLSARARPGPARCSSRSRAGRTGPCTGASPGRCACSPGFGTPEDTNPRFKFLLAHGQTGLSTAFDMPTLMGYDPDHPLVAGRGRARGGLGGQPGRHAPAVRRHPARPGQHLDDHQRPGGGAAGACTRRWPRSGASTRPADRAPSRTTCSRSSSPRRNGSAACGRTCASSATCWSTAPAACPAGTPSASAATTSARRGRRRCRSWRSRWPTASATSSWACEAGLAIDDFAPRLSFFWDVHNDFFEEIAKLRAARRMWARIMRDRFGARNPRSWLLRAHAQTAGRLAGGAAAAQQRGAHHAAGAGRRAGRACSRCTPTATTRPTLCPPRRRPPWRCAPSRSSPRRPGSQRWPTRWGAATSSRPSPIRWRRPPSATWTRSTPWAASPAAIEEGYPQREIAASAYAHQRRSMPASESW